MDFIVAALAELSFVEMMAFLLFLVLLGKSKRNKAENYNESASYSISKKKGMKIKEAEIPKHPRVIKRKKAEFRRFLAILIPLIVLGYFMISNYLGSGINIITLTLIIIGVLFVSVFIFIEIMKRYE